MGIAPKAKGYSDASLETKIYMPSEVKMPNLCFTKCARVNTGQGRSVRDHKTWKQELIGTRSHMLRGDRKMPTRNVRTCILINI